MCIVVKNSATPAERIAYLERQLYAQLKRVESLRIEVLHLRGDHSKCGPNEYCHRPRKRWCPNSCHLYDGKVCKECR